MANYDMINIFICHVTGRRLIALPDFLRQQRGPIEWRWLGRHVSHILHFNFRWFKIAFILHHPPPPPHSFLSVRRPTLETVEHFNEFSTPVTFKRPIMEIIYVNFYEFISENCNSPPHFSLLLVGRIFLLLLHFNVTLFTELHWISTWFFNVVLVVAYIIIIIIII